MGLVDATVLEGTLAGTRLADHDGTWLDRAREALEELE
jgi:hypothetical protein